ncbi:hypothetical protein Despr_2905 [Candidatus Moduliflexus flocculans]|uniref:Uncharacterized protein n=1 Tax=Candidatus Moduliflexus flocculans TaxID=1499966 RepID=A0A0S6VRQ9_9BACT|nr:hypothetical protein Despr_2905 [Candidatus Moduliflexus flocculans]
MMRIFRQIVCLCLMIGILSDAAFSASDASEKARVKQAQIALRQRGYQIGQVDGIWGKQTRAALTRFQQDQGLPVSGELDDATLADLGLLSPALPTSGAAPVAKVPTVILRAAPAELSAQEIDSMIRKNGFHHPGDVSAGGLSPTRQGAFSHQYEATTLRGDPVVSDLATGLMWQQRPTPFIRHQDLQRHLSATNAQSYAGFTDWRLPTIEELASLLEPPDKQRDFLDPIFAMPYWLCLSADHVSGNPTQVWVVFFEEGIILPASAHDDYDVLLVRNAHQ